MQSFEFQKGRILAQKYEVLGLLGTGFEGEVYKIRETATDIMRAAKFFFPKRNQNNKSLRNYAKKLDLLSDCSILIQYKTTEFAHFKGEKIPFMVSDFVDGILLSEFITRFPGKRLPYYHGLHLFYQLIDGLSQIHAKKSFHGDIHTDNIMIHSFGLKHKMKLIDFHDIGIDKRLKMKQDLYDSIEVLFEILGGKKQYKNHPEEIKYILCGKRSDVIDRRFKNIHMLKNHLEALRFRSIL